MTRKAVVGTCHGCGSRTVRGELDDGTLVEAEVGNLTAADELRAWATGVPTYRAVWKLHIQLDPRVDRDLKLNPAGYDGARIWKQHTCTTTEGNTSMKIRRQHKPDINLEVLGDAERGMWVIRQFGGDPNKVIDVQPTRDDAEHVAAVLAKVFAVINADGSCEVHVRELDGTFGDPSTYGHDPVESDG